MRGGDFILTDHNGSVVDLKLFRCIAVALLCAPAILGGPSLSLGNGEEEGDEGHFQEPVILEAGKTHHGSVGDFSESFYAFKATAETHRISVVGSQGVKWRLFAGADFKEGLKKWCKAVPAGGKFRTACSVDGLEKGRWYYLNVYSFSPGHTKYDIGINTP